MFARIVAQQLDVVMLQFVYGDLMLINAGIGRRVRLLVSWVTLGCPSSDRYSIRTYGWVCTDLKVLLDSEIDWSQVPVGDPRRQAFYLVQEIHDCIKMYLRQDASTQFDEYGCCQGIQNEWR